MSEPSRPRLSAAAAELTVVDRWPVEDARVDSAGVLLLLGERSSTKVVGLDRTVRATLTGNAKVAYPCETRCTAIVWQQDALRAVDLTGGRERWASRAIAAGSAVTLVSVLAVSDALVIELDWAPSAGGLAQRQWWVFDQATGALRFRFDRADDRWLAPWPRSPGRNDAIAYRTRSGGIGLVDPKFGRPRWQVDEPGAPADFVLADDRGVIVAGNFGPVVGLDRATGQRRFSRALPDRRVSAITLDGDRIWVLTNSAESRERGIDHATLAWIDRRSGEHHTIAPWPSITGGAAATRAGESNAGLWPANDTLLVTAGDGILRALHRDDGRPQWSWGIGGDAQVALAGPPGALHPTVVAAGELWVFGHGPPQPILETELHGTVTVNGKPAGEVTVLVGDAETQSDSAGAYRLRVRAQGRLTIHAGRACVDGSGAFDGTTQIVLGAEPSIRADVQATAVDCD